MLPTRTFTTTLQPRPRGGVVVRLPFSPGEVWRDRDHWYVRGTIGGFGVRGVVEDVDGAPCLTLGPSWCRDPSVAPGTTVEVRLEPEGPQLETVPDELRAALEADAGGSAGVRVAGDVLPQGLRRSDRFGQAGRDPRTTGRPGHRGAARRPPRVLIVPTSLTGIERAPAVPGLSCVVRVTD